MKWASGPNWFNHEGEVVEREEDTFGRKTEYELIFQEKILFVNEVGCKTSQKNDGNIGREKFLVCPDSQV